MEKILVKDKAKWAMQKKALTQKYFDKVLFNLWAVAESQSNSNKQFAELILKRGRKYRRMVVNGYYLIYISDY